MTPASGRLMSSFRAAAIVCGAESPVEIEDRAEQVFDQYGLGCASRGAGDEMAMGLNSAGEQELEANCRYGSSVTRRHESLVRHWQHRRQISSTFPRLSRPRSDSHIESSNPSLSANDELPFNIKY
jgi:hypothetical protein